MLQNHTEYYQIIQNPTTQIFNGGIFGSHLTTPTTETSRRLHVAYQTYVPKRQFLKKYMSEAQLINTMLYRKLESGSQYSGLIPSYKHVKHSFELPAEYSDTYNTLEYMADWTNKYANQFQKVANVLKGENVLETVKNNYNFLYKHFQYKIDENLQQIYAPSAAWHFRKVGFDCKTFSSLASALLLCQNIDHSFVKVKLQGSNDWGHVYVQIPYQGSYLIIDATTHDNKEVDFIEKHEFNMKNLKHIGLASPYLNTPYLNLDNGALSCPGMACDCNSGLSNPYTAPFLLTPEPTTPFVAGLNGIDLGSISSIVNQLDFNSISSLFSGLDCIGGSAFSDSRFKSNVEIINTLFSNIVEDINQDVKFNNAYRLGEFAAEFKAYAKLLKEGFTRKKASQSWNSCSKKKFDDSIKLMQFYTNVCDVALAQWINSNFNVKINNAGSFKVNGESEGLLNIWGAGLSKTIEVIEVFKIYTPKIQQIKAFELNAYVVESVKNNTFSIAQYLQTAQSVLSYIDTPLDAFPEEGFTGNNNNTNPGSGSTGLPKSTSKMSGGTIAFAGLLLAGGIWGFSKMKDNGPGAKPTKKK